MVTRGKKSDSPTSGGEPGRQIPLTAATELKTLLKVERGSLSETPAAR